MIVTIDWIKKHYNEFNALMFNNELPNDLTFKISKSKNTWGFASFKYDYPNSTIKPTSITISNYYDSPEHVKKNTLIHEMIHIYDYVLNPHHFIRNGRRVSGHTYNAHGWWFQEQCDRIRKYGYNIDTKVTADELKVSSLSDESKKKLAKKLDDCLMIVIRGVNKNWMCKTNHKNLPNVLKAVTKINWKWSIGLVNSINVYSFTDEKYASVRNCNTSLRGWSFRDAELEKKLKSINAVEVKTKTLMKPYLKALDKKGYLNNCEEYYVAAKK